MNGWWLLAGIVLGGPLWLGAALWVNRRVWRHARRVSARSKGLDQLAELGQLAGGLAHEIRNPLSTINVNLSLVSEDLQRYDDDDHRRWLRRLRNVQDESVRLREILDDFLRYAGKYELTLAAVDVREIVQELVDFFSPQAQAAGVLMRTALPDEPVFCNIDTGLIKQALLNLMINGTEAMEAGGELLLRVSTTKTSALIEVIDTGPGIPTDQLDKIFQVYHSTKSSGTGLGLPTTRRIVREHGGDINVDSAEGKGTRFAISLPKSSGRANG